jgi:hypothetical protein
MIVAAIVWLIGVVCAVAIGLSINHGVDDGEPRYSGTEIGWGSLLWPLVILTLVVVEVYVRWTRRPS